MDRKDQDRAELAAGARKLAIDIVLTALIEHAGRQDPAFKSRVAGLLDAYLDSLPKSEMALAFTSQAQANLAFFLRSDRADARQASDFDRRPTPNQEPLMPVRKISVADARFERSPGQAADIFAANVIDQRHGAPVSIGYGRYAPDQVLTTDILVDDVMIVLEGQVSVSSERGEETAGPGEIVHMPKGSTVTLRSGKQGALTAYVTYPHWQEAEG